MINLFGKNSKIR